MGRWTDPDYQKKWYQKNRERLIRKNVSNDRLRRYKIFEDQYQRMVFEREGKCEICSRVPTGRWKNLCVDHNHATGKIRGLLCHACNKALGLLQDNPDIVQEAKNYLERTTI